MDTAVLPAQALLAQQQTLYQKILTAQNPEQVARIAVDYAYHLLAVDRASVVLINLQENKVTTLVVKTAKETQIPEGTTLKLTGLPFLQALRRGQYVLLDEHELEIYKNKSPGFAVLYQDGLRAMAFIPLMTQGKLVGSLNLSTVRPQNLTPQELEIAEEIATPVAIAIQQLQLHEETQRQSEELKKRERFLAQLTNITNESAEIEDFNQMLQFIADNLLTLFSADNCYITNLNEETNQVFLMAAAGQSAQAFKTTPPIPAEGTITRSILIEERVIAVNDTASSPFIQSDIAARFNEAAIIGIPLISRTEKFGAALLSFEHVHPFTHDEIIRAQQTAIPLSLVIAKTNLLRQEREQRELAEAFRDVGKILNATLNVEEILERILDQIARVVPFDAASILLVQNGRVLQTRQSNFIDQVEKIPIPSHLADQLPDHIQTIITSKIPETRTFPQAESTTGQQPAANQSWLGVPIIIQGDVAAIINIEKAEPHFYSRQHIMNLTTFAGQVALALHNARLFDASQRQLEEMSVLQALAVAGAEVLDEDELFDQATQIIGDTLFPHNFGILLLDESVQALKIHPSYRLSKETERNQAFPLSSGIVGHVASSGRPYRCNDIEQDPYYKVVDPETKSELCVPLLMGNKVIGVINTESSKINGFSDSEEYLLTTFAHQLGIAVEKLRLLSETQRQAEELRLISRILRYLNATPEVSVVFPELNANIKRLTHCTAVALYLLTPQQTIKQIISEDFNSPFPHINDLDETIAAASIRNGQIYKIPDLKNELSHPFEKTLNDNDMQASIYIPLSAREEPFGFLNLVWDKVNGYHDIPFNRFQKVAVGIALALHRSALFEEFKQWAHLLAILHELSHQLAGLVEVEDLCTTCARQLNRNLSFQSVSVFTVDENTQKLSIRALEGPNKHRIKLGQYTQNIGEGLIGLAAQTRKTLIVNDTENHPDFLPSPRIDVRAELVIPLMQGGHVIGILNVDSETPNAFTDTDIGILKIAADQLAATLGRAQLFEQTRQHANSLEQRNRELVALIEVSQLLVATLDRHTIYQALYRKIIEPLMKVPHFTIALYDPNTQIIYCDYAITDGEETDVSQFPSFPFGEGLLSETIRARQPRIVNLSSALPVLKAKGRVVHVGDDRKPNSGLYLPLISGDNVMGIMYVQDYPAEAFNQDDVRLLSMLASQASVAIEKSRLFEDTKARAAKLEALSALSTELRTAKSIDDMLPAILQKAMSVVGGSLGSLYMLDKETGELVARGVYPPNPALIGRRFQVGEGITGYIAATGEIHITENMAESKIARFYPEEKELVIKEKSIRSGIGLPLQTSEKIIGVIYINLPHEHKFSNEEIEFLTAIAEISSSALDRMELLQSLEERVAERTKELAKANEQLKELDRLKSKFISEVSHELRTPITNLSLYLDLFSQSKPEKHEHYLTVLQKQKDRLSQLIEDVLSLSRVELGKEKLKLGAVDFNKVVLATIELQMPRIEEKDLALNQSLAEELPAVYGEENQLAQVISHLLENAIIYTIKGTITISSGFDRERQQVYLTVADTGLGISEEDMPHLFDRFYRGGRASQSNIPGTGLGLVIVKEIIDLHGGGIEVNGRENEGSSFTIWLPTYESSEKGEKEDDDTTTLA